MTPPSRLKIAVFALLPALVLFAGIEGVFRLLELASPRLRSIPLPEEEYGLLRPDEDLLWSLKPDTHLPFAGDPRGYNTNRLGLRSAEVGPKRPGELRILAVGESTTFGVRVRDADAYPQRLEAILRETGACPGCRVINAGVPAWSSYQTLRYLTRRGFALEPDVVLLYHEINDYMPSSLRTSANDERGLLRSDRQLLESARGSWMRRLVARSALVRAFVYRAARHEIERLRDGPGFVSPAAIGIPAIGVRSLVVDADDSRRAGVNEAALPTRVLPGERPVVLREILEACRSHGAALVVIHPSYRRSSPHRCALTEFCAGAGVPMLEAYDVLHPAGVPVEEMFFDHMHPTRRGHEALARRLADFLAASGHLGPRR